MAHYAPLPATHGHAAENLYELRNRHRLRAHDAASLAGRVADRRRVGLRVDQGKGPSQLPQIVQIRIAEDRLAVRLGPARRARVEVEGLGPEMSPLHAVRQG